LILDLSRKPKVTVEHSDAGILVTLPGTGFSVIYVKTDDNRLIASAFSSARGLPEKHKVNFPQFLALAWAAANAKAKELGWTQGEESPFSQFYLADENGAQLCREALRARMPITITGFAADGTIKAFTGIVQAVEEDQDRLPSHRWRVTMRENESN